MGIKTFNKSIITALAEAISSFNIGEVGNLLSDTGEFAFQNESFEIIMSGKKEFLNWLECCLKRSPLFTRLRKKLSFEIVQSLHHVAGNPIIVFEDGRFPLFSPGQTRKEHSGLVIKSFENKITGIELCFLIVKTENPFIYEKRRLKPAL